MESQNQIEHETTVNVFVLSNVSLYIMNSLHTN
jgi:hypothetical protein